MPAVANRDGSGCDVEASGRIPELDGIRGIAVLMVLTWHFVGEVIDTGLGSWAWWLNRTTVVGRTGVDLFFVLSGLLITGIILDRCNDTIAFLRSFYLRRALRILPPYIALIAGYQLLCVVGALPYNNDISILRFLSFTQTWWMAHHGSWGPQALSVTWSVSVEEHYYLIFPLVLLCTPRRLLPWLLLAVALGSAMLRAWLYFGRGDNYYYSYVFPFSRLDGLALGGVVASVVRNPDARRHIARYERKLFPLALSLALSLEIVVGWGLYRDVPVHMFSWGHFALAVVFSILLLSIMLKSGDPTMAFLRSELLRQLGTISYSLYLFHPLLLLLVFRMSVGRSPHIASWSDITLLAVAAVCSWLVAAAFKPLERRAIAYGHRYAY